MKRVLLAALLVSPACGGRAQLAAEAANPAVRLEGVAAELDVVARYAAHLQRECSDRTTELFGGARGTVRIATDPPIDEVDWRLEVCGRVLDFRLDCSARGDRGTVCHPHGWPPVIRYPDRVPLAQEIEAVIALARRDGRCDDRWCPPERCDEPPVRVRWRASGPQVDRYEVERCGVVRDAAVDCGEGALECTARFDPPRR